MPSQVLGVNILREDRIRQAYPESYTDCGTNDDEQCPKGYPGAVTGSKEWNEAMKFTSFVFGVGKEAGKLAGKVIRQISSGGECPKGRYAEAAAVKPTAPDITLGGKNYNCKGGARMHPPPQRPPP